MKRADSFIFRDVEGRSPRRRGARGENAENISRYAPRFLWLLCASAVASVFCILPLHQMQASQKTSQQELFEKVFGEKAFIDPAIVSRLKNHPEERIKLDLDGDGKIDTIYFIDHDPRRQQEFRPLLVKAIDRDGDMERDGAADLDSDLYIADWHADGVVDSVVEYRDTDRDNVGEKIAHSRGGRRYYLDMIRERYFYRITRAMAKQPELLRQIEEKYDAGNYAGVADQLHRLFKNRERTK